MNNRSKEQTAVIFSPSSRGHKSRPFSRTPPQRREEKRPVTGSYGPNLQVQGFCCPLLHRPSTRQPSPQGPVTQPPPEPNQPSTTSLLLLTTIRARLESRVLPASRSRTGTKSGLSKISTTPCVSNISPTEMAPTDPRKGQVQTGSELHLYLPSSKCEEDEEEDSQH